MFNEFICIFRRYCKLSQEDVALAARIPLERYREYEYGLRDADDETLRRLAKIFGLNENIFKLGIEPFAKTYELFEPTPVDYNIFESEQDRENVKLLVNLLRQDEARLLLLYRTAAKKDKKRIMNAAMRSIENIDSVTEESVDEYLMTKIGTYAEQSVDIAEEYGIPEQEATQKIEAVFSGESMEKIQNDILKAADDIIHKAIRNVMEK